ncbi:MAG: hypothetical protein IJ421_09080 [Prevotella sp.]|nr:hypothetical protein [Prevotella sp.]
MSKHVLSPVQPRHLSIHPAQQFVIAVGRSGVCLVYCIVIALKGTGCVAHVAVGAAEEIMGTHAFLGCAVSVVVGCHLTHHAVGGEVDKCLVLRVSTQQLKAHLLAAAHVGGSLSTEAVKHDEDGVGMCGQQAVGMVEHRGGTAVGAAEERQHH